MNSELSGNTVEEGEPSWLLSLRVLERHIGVVVAILFVPLNQGLAILLFASYALRIFALEGIYHRYFAHRSYRMGRGMQFLFALWGAQCGQRGPLWWAALHRDHHKYADTERDPHSPVTQPFWYAYLGWFVDPKHRTTDLAAVRDFARYPELRWLNRHYLFAFYGVAVLLGVAGYLGWLGPGITLVSAVMWGFYVPSFLQVHAIASVNALCHLPGVPGGYRRFETDDSSINRPLLALVTFGAGFHNNHHRHAAVARAGFAWYEVDVTYALLRIMQALKIIHGVKAILPDNVLDEGRLQTRTS